MGRNLTRWLIPLPAILFAVAPQNANAEPVAGLATTYYTIDVIPPVQSTSEYPVCGTETENNINRSYNGEPYEDCTGDLFMVHITGFITIPEHNTIEFWLASDDGGEITIDGNTFGIWNDQNCAATESGPLEMQSGSQPLELWMYENGGDTCIMLAWNINGAGWEMVPDEAFTTNGAPTTTTTTSPTTTTTTTTSTTTTSTTTTLPPTTTTTSSTTTLPPETTTTTSTTVLETTTTTTVPSTTTTTTTQVPWTPPQTTTTSTTTTTEPEPATTTTTSLPETSTTLEETSTTYLPYPLEEPVEPNETTVPDEIVPDETDAPTTTEQQTEEITDTTLEEVEDSSSTTIADVPETSKPIMSNEQFQTVLNDIEDASPTEIVAIIETVLATDISSDQAAELVSNVAVLEVINESEAEQLFSEVVPADLTEEQAELIVEAVQSAPTKIRQAFEGVIDIFGSQFENYVPTGSNVPVSTRRTMVAIGATLTMLPTRVKR